MASADTEKLRSSMWVKGYDFDPGGTDPVDVAWVDARDYGSFLFQFFRTIGTGDVDTFRIIANTASNGSGSDVVIKTHAVGSQPDAVADQLFLECSAEEIAAAGDNLRYISAQVEFATGTDEGVVNYIFANPRFHRQDLTADIVA